MALMLWCCDAVPADSEEESEVASGPWRFCLWLWRKDTKRKRKWEAISCLNKSQQSLEASPASQAFYEPFTRFLQASQAAKVIQNWSKLIQNQPMNDPSRYCCPGLQHKRQELVTLRVSKLFVLQKQVSSIPFYRQLISFTQIRNVNNVNMIYKYINIYYYYMMRYLNIRNASSDLLLQSLFGFRQCPQHQRCTKANKENQTGLPVLHSITWYYMYVYTVCIVQKS